MHLVWLNHLDDSQGKTFSNVDEKMKRTGISMKAKLTISAVGMVLMGMSHYMYADIGFSGTYPAG